MPIIIDSVNMLEDVIFLDIDNIVPSWDTYCFALDIHSPGRKRVVLRFKDAQILQLKNGKDEEDNSPEEGTVAEASDDNVELVVEASDDNVELVVEALEDKEESVVETSEDKDELVVETWEEESAVQTSEDEEEELVVPVPIPLASPCDLLTRRFENPNPDPDNPTAPWRYYVRPIDETHLSAKAEKRYAEEELQERFKKPRKV
ncbi:hypothetical protein EV424DRAFT_1551028 [Suillus variegatus]|nr:hypothetical protein EV424DRAFT_1551028 [Suillus variegatus]